jgi:hypothetical protein
MWERLAVDVAAMLALIFAAVILDDALDTAVPAAMAGYLWGATAAARLCWIKTGQWQ